MLFFSDVFYLTFFLFKKDLAGGALFQKGSKKGSVAASANAECLYVARTTKKEREKGNVIPALLYLIPTNKIIIHRIFKKVTYRLILLSSGCCHSRPPFQGLHFEFVVGRLITFGTTFSLKYFSIAFLVWSLRWIC